MFIGEICMDLDEIYQEFPALNEQQYTNTSRVYWHGSLMKGLHSIKASVIYGKTIPLARVSNSFNYAARYAFKEGYVYHVRQIGNLNIWNPRADKDWSDLVNKYPEFNVGITRKSVTNYDWFGGFIRAGKLRIIERNDLLEAIQALGYSGVFNKEDHDGKPSLGVFEGFTNLLRVVDAYAWDENTKLWRSVGYPNRAYDPKMKKFIALKESEDKNDFTEVEHERQNFLEGFI
ncbi:MAG: hypothetical protein LBE13_18950 [Bacteroidales bacterium]|jgi:hypothetical protein|nr:hypothetical protein [Bacteroidales bacterium]